jgi:phosphoenolpyruvate carboxykinase (GTP)
VWPGFGENGRVLKWAIERMSGTAEARETPIGRVPTAESLDTDGLDMSAEDLEVCLTVDNDEWRAEIPQITEWFEKFGNTLPTVLWTELDGLKARLGAS